MVICPNFFPMPQKSELSHLLKTLKAKNLLSQKPSRWNHFCISFVGLNVPLSYERLKCFRKYIFRLLELRKEKRQSQKELNWNEKHFPGLCSPELIRSSIGSLKSLLGENSFSYDRVFLARLHAQEYFGPGPLQPESKQLFAIPIRNFNDLKGNSRMYEKTQISLH